MNTFHILCPNCKTNIPLTEALTHQVQEQLESDFRKRLALSQQALAEREQQLAAQKESLEKSKLELDTRVSEKLAAERAKIVATALAEAKLASNVEVQDLRERLADRQKQLEAAQKAELELRRREGQLQSRAEALELEVARKLNDERGRIREEARQAANEEHGLKAAESAKLIADMQKQIASLKQKAEQGSQQLQGEVLELDLEEQLRAAFPHDHIEPVAKGTKGGDVLHRVRNNTGHDCGTIVWEAKRTKAWSNGWTAKIKEDQRAVKAEMAVIVSVALPEKLRNLGMVDGVWVCDSVCMLALATALRQGLISTGSARLAQTGKATKMEELYTFLCSTEFRQHIEGVVEAFLAMEQGLEKERNAMKRIWAAREKQLKSAINHTTLLYGSIQGIAGANAVPDIKPLQLDDAPYEEETAEQDCDTAMVELA